MNDHLRIFFTVCSLSLSANYVATAQTVGTQISQFGSDNSTEATQNGEGNQAIVSIIGNSNSEGEIRQNSNGAYANIEIVGDQNAFYVDQSGVAGNVAIADVRGDANALFIDQINPESSAYQNYSTVVQTGTGHSASVDQMVVAYETLGTNLAVIAQDGLGHSGVISQTGTQNSASLEQYGDYNEGAIFQDGSGHSAELVQDGQNLDAIQIRQADCVISGGCPTLRIEQTQAMSIVSGPSLGGTVVQPGTSVVLGGNGK